MALSVCEGTVREGVLFRRTCIPVELGAGPCSVIAHQASGLHGQLHAGGRAGRTKRGHCALEEEQLPAVVLHHQESRLERRAHRALHLRAATPRK